MPAIDLVVTDLDGTFLGKDSQILQRNLEIFTKAAELGVKIVFATGRPPRMLDILQPLLHLDPLVISSNGAVVYDLASGQASFSYPIDAEVGLSVAEDLKRAVPDITFATEYVSGWAHEPDFPVKDFPTKAQLVAEVADILTFQPSVKFIARSRQLNSDQLGELADSLMAGRLTSTWSYFAEIGLIEMSATGVTKGSTLSRLLADLSIDPARVAGFGDMPNDKEMLDLVGYPHAVANCHQSLKQSGYLPALANTESGVGEALLELL